MILLVEFFAVPALTAGTAGMVLGLIFVYFAGRFWIYPPVKGVKAAGIEIFLFIILSVIGAGIHTIVLSVGLNNLEVHYIIVKCIAATLMFCWNYLSRRAANRWIRNRHHQHEVSK